MTLTHVCTVATTHDVAGVRVLAAALAEHHPGTRVTVAALPGARRALEAVPGVEVVTLADLEVPGADTAPGLLPVPVLAALARPLLLRQALARGADGALLLAADCDVRGPLTELETAVERSQVVLLRRLVGRLPDDGERPDAGDLVAAGEVDEELIAVRDGPGAARFLAWWLELAVAGSRELVPRTDAHPLDAAPRALDGIEVLTDPGYGVSSWNLHERPLTDDAGLRADGRPLRLVRFAGFRPDRPWWLSERASRARVLDDPVLARLCRERSTALLAAGWEPPAAGRDPAAGLALGLHLDDRLRRLLREAADEQEDFGDLTEASGAAALLGWLAEPAPAGGAAGLNRYTHDAWRARADLQAAYPNLDDPEDAQGFVGWLWVHGRVELGLDARLLPPAPEWVEDAGRSVPSVQVLGYLRGNLGLGQAARGYAAALRAGGVPVGTHTVPLDGPQDERGVATRRHDEFAYEDDALGDDADVVLACVNAPQLPGLVELVGEDSFAGRYVIGQWGWETDAIPSYWAASFDLVDEVWVYSTYVADVIAAVSPKPVVAVPLPVQAPAHVAEDHGLELPAGDFTFLFAFDFLSTLQRKNPVGLIEAFKRAFRPGEGPRLVLKTTNARFRPELHDRLRFTLDGRPDIAIVDASLAPPQMAALFAQADCYVSLHRSEGFGLTLAESMVLGKPVIATGFGGNLDFMRPSNSHLVEYEPTLVGPEGEHYPAEGTWAEPSLEHAAELMRAVWQDQDAACALGERARRDIEAQLDPAAVGAIARRRLEHLPSRRAQGTPAPPLPYPIGDLDRRLRFDLAQGAGGSPTGPRGLAKRSALRAMRPYTEAERHLDEALVVSVRQLAGELQRLTAARERDRDRIARLERRLRSDSGRAEGT